MKLKELLPNGKPVSIMVRTNAPVDSHEEDILVGYCGWDGEKLIDLDGDCYSVDDEVVRFEFDECDGITWLIYWTKSTWI